MRNIIDLLQYKIKNDFNKEVINKTRVVILTAKGDGFNNVLANWAYRLDIMIDLDINDIEINKDNYIEDLKYDFNKMMDIIYNQ